MNGLTINGHGLGCASFECLPCDCGADDWIDDEEFWDEDEELSS